MDAKIPQGLFIPEKNYTDFIPNSVYMDEAAYEDAQNMPYLFGFSSIEEILEKSFLRTASLHL